jgi:hypothetical protein
VTERRAALLVALVALLSVALGARPTLGFLGAAEREFAGRSRAEAELQPIRHEGGPTEPWAFFRSRLRPGDRYALRVGAGAERGFVDEGTIARTYAGFALLPARQVLSEEDADVVLILGENVPPGAECHGPDWCVVRRRG